LLSERNPYFEVKYVVDADGFRRERAEGLYAGCQTFADYRELFDRKDIDLVVNATYSEDHYPITKALLEHGFNVLVEKPFARSRYECEELMQIAEQKQVVLAVFQQTFLAPFYLFTRELMQSGKLGEIKQISIRYNNFARRWDWQTLQKKCAGGVYNTGPHPIGIGLGLLDFDPEAKLVYSRLDTALTSGDSDDYAKLLIAASGKPLVDIEINSTDAYSDYNIKLQGSLGTYKATPKGYEMTYIQAGENPERPVIETFLQDDAGEPIYCSEKLVKHTESGTFDGDAFNVGTARLYEQLYFKITEGKPMTVTPQMAAEIISVVEQCHAADPLPLKY
ncbi:MAG: Gfo/Idh/MocA family oxidoreductase, partial [Clostridia bacterium]|nr:Gfo/Idh/MocA family oxidoreductase [Clostridia bacterium]